MEAKPIRLNLGCGALLLADYTNIDRTPVSPAVQQGEVYPLSHEDESVDEIRASHVLEHFPGALTAAVLTDWIRALRPGGILKIAVPNFRWIAQSYLEGKQFPLSGFVFGGQTDANDFHKAAFDEEGLREALSLLGLVEIEPWTSEIDDCASLAVSLNLMGRKASAPVGAVVSHPDPDLPTGDFGPTEDLPTGISIDEYMGHPDRRFAHYTIAPGDVRAVMTAPRLGFTETLNCAMRAFGRLNIDFNIAYGVFWTQGLERAMTRELERGSKYVLTLDYDTVFDWRDVQTLYGIMESRPDIGALAPIQMRRDLGVALIGARDPDTDGPMANVPWERLQEDVLEVGTAHFGLTMIRTSCLAGMPHPWFRETPNPETGMWDDGRTDADVKFWLDFGAAGNKLCIANRVTIGHMELVVTWPDRFLRPAIQASGEYHAIGRPGRESNLWR